MRETMNVYSPKGSKVRFSFPHNGYSGEQESIQQYMKYGDVFTVDFTSVGGSYTSVYLKEIPERSFNSVFFENVNDDGATENFTTCWDDDNVDILDFISENIKKDIYANYEVTVNIKKVKDIYESEEE